MKNTLLIAVLVLAGCGENSGPRVEDVQTDSTRYRMGKGYFVREFRLNDGTRCVVSADGGIACEWQPKQ